MKNRNRIFILPTGFGLIFILGALIMILIGSAYQNNLVNMVAFFMLSLIFVCMIQTHSNLKDIHVFEVEAEGGFAGKDFLVTTVIANEAKVPRHNLESRARKLKIKSIYENFQDLPAGGTLKLRATYPAYKRGVFNFSGCRVSSVYPLGLFEAWRWFNDAKCLYHIYPEPKGTLAFPKSSDASGDGAAIHLMSGDDFQGHRKFQTGESYRHIDWKANARGRPLLIKQFNEGSPGALVFDWNHLPGVDTESRLSQLSKWIDEAKSKKEPFALRLPNQSLPPGQGLQHAIKCWKSLAAYADSNEHQRNR